MAIYDIGAIRAAIKSLLQSVSSVEVVYDSKQAALAGYPAVVFELDREQGDILDDVNNQRKLTFKLWVVVEAATQGMDAAKDMLDAVTKDVVNALESKSNLTLSGTADWTMPVIGGRDFVQTPEGLTGYQELQLEVHVVSSIA